MVNSLNHCHYRLLMLTNVVMYAVVMDISFVGELVCSCVFPLLVCLSSIYHVSDYLSIRTVSSIYM